MKIKWLASFQLIIMGVFCVVGLAGAAPESATVSISTIPDPSTLAMLSLGLMGLGLARFTS